MTDNAELKRLAEAAPEGPWFGPEYAPGTSYVFDVDLGTLLEYQSIDTEKDACLRYVAAANPAAVLALIAENERLRAIHAVGPVKVAFDVMDERDQLRAEIAGLKTGYEAYERVNAELKAENERLRSGMKGDYDLDAWLDWTREVEALRKAFTECADSLHGEMLQKFGGQLPDDMHPVTRREYDRDMAEVAGYRVALGQGEQS